MSAEPGEVEALARAFARHLEHLREFRGVHYVGAAQMLVGPTGEHDHDHEDPDTPSSAASPPDPTRSATRDSEYSRVADHPSGAYARDPSGAYARDPSGAYARDDSGVYARDSGAPAGDDSGVPAGDDSGASPHDHGVSPPQNGAPPASAPAVTTPRAVATARAGEWPAAKKLAYLRDRNVGDCHRCPLSATRQNIVFGVGDPDADLMFVGEAPGGDEDRVGEPFVGVAGQRLDRWLAQLGLGRERVYIANVLKCRPPGNRDPHPMEIDRCAPFLHAQIRAIEPKVLVALGRFAGCLLLGVDAPLYKMRGQTQRYREPKTGAEIPVVVTYHPSYVIRTERKGSGARGPRAQTDRGGVIKSEDQKVLDDLERAVSLTR